MRSTRAAHHVGMHLSSAPYVVRQQLECTRCYQKERLSCKYHYFCYCLHRHTHLKRQFCVYHSFLFVLINDSVKNCDRFLTFLCMILYKLCLICAFFKRFCTCIRGIWGCSVLFHPDSTTFCAEYLFIIQNQQHK